MTAADILDRARAAGVELFATAGRLRWRCRGQLPDELRQLLQANKTAVLRLLDWDQVEAERLLADLRATVERIARQGFGGKPPASFLALAEDAVAIAEGYIRDHDREAARGWDALDLLRGVKSVLCQAAGRLGARGENLRPGAAPW
jgi:hypothetical protein